MDWAHHCPPSPPPLILLQMSTSGSSWEDRMKMFHLFSPLCGVPKVPEVTGDHNGHYPSDDQAGTVRELPMSGGKADWSAPQAYGGHRGHGEGLLCVDLVHQLTVVACKTAERWKRSCIIETVLPWAGVTSYTYTYNNRPGYFVFLYGAQGLAIQPKYLLFKGIQSRLTNFRPRRHRYIP